MQARIACYYIAITHPTMSVMTNDTGQFFQAVVVNAWKSISCLGDCINLQFVSYRVARNGVTSAIPLTKVSRLLFLFFFYIFLLKDC